MCSIATKCKASCLARKRDTETKRVCRKLDKYITAATRATQPSELTEKHRKLDRDRRAATRATEPLKFNIRKTQKAQ